MDRNNRDPFLEPASLKEVITYSLMFPSCYLPDKMEQQVHDFLSQKFGAALIRYSDDPAAQKVIMDLWSSLYPSEKLNS